MNLRDLKHIAIIMDGNGRWAQARGRTRTFGHREGVAAVRAITTACAEAHLSHLTLYALSTENFQNRPRREVSILMALLRRFMIKERPTLMENRVRFKTIGRLEALPARVVAEIRTIERLTAQNDNLVLTLALNYGGRAELADAAQCIAREVAAGRLSPECVDEALMARHLYDSSAPDVDLLIRTGGEFRISNFLLWQLSYSEFYVTPTLWPDFRPRHLQEAVTAFRNRCRKFGGLLEGVDH